LDQAIAGAERLEKMLCDEGALIFKFWFHLSKKQMKARLKALADDPLHSWRISPLDWQQSETYDKFVHFGERILRRTSRDYAPWYVIEGVDAHYRSLTVGKILLESLQNALKLPKGKASGMNPAPLLASVDQKSLLDSLDMTLRLDKDDYEEQLITE
ncbi:polyphosphate kinase, partial [Pseudomonas argentinensis]